MERTMTSTIDRNETVLDRNSRGVALSADTVIGTPVIDMNGESVGNIKDLMLDVGHGRIRYAVLDFGGILGIGNKLFAVPFDALEADTENKRFVLRADREKLENAEGFDQNDWPDFANERFDEGLFAFYGVTPYWHSAN